MLVKNAKKKKKKKKKIIPVLSDKLTKMTCCNLYIRNSALLHINFGADWHSCCALDFGPRGPWFKPRQGRRPWWPWASHISTAQFVDSVYSLNQLVAMKALQSLC